MKLKQLLSNQRILVLSLFMIMSAFLVERSVCSAEPFDIVIRGGAIVDGTGRPRFVGDIAVQRGRIVKIGAVDSKDEKKTVDASGLIVAPGFIDLMGQTATPMLNDPRSALNLLTQGITTINAGEGASAAPLDDEQGARQGWTTMAEYLALLDLRGVPVNVAQSVGHTQVRRIVLGDVDRRPSPDELMRMRELVREAMTAGAIGLSTALIYPPAVFATQEEITSLAEVAGEHGGGYYTHMRNEGDRLLEAIDEAIEIGRVAKTPVHIFHLKTAGEHNWPKMPQALSRIQAARDNGHHVAVDIYPYVNNGLEISAFVHPRHFTNGRNAFLSKLDDATFRSAIRQEMESTDGWENWYRHVGKDWDRVIIGQAKGDGFREFGGKSVRAIAKARSEDPWETFFHLIRSGAFALPQSMSEANKVLALKQNFVSFCTDVGPAGGELFVSHPRAFGSFPRIFSRYVRELKAISLEQAVAQATSVAAREIFATDRGRLAEGLAADIIVFDEEQIADRATFAEPRASSEGIKHVMVNGEIVLSDGKLTRERPGRVLRGPGYRPEFRPNALVSGKCDDRLRGIDQAMRQFIEKFQVPGAALTVTKNGRLMLARGYGYSDLATRRQVEPTSLFRIASISKPITAVAILQLVERGKLKLDDRVFDVLDFQTEIEAAGSQVDARLKTITIRQLLEHRGGWDRDKSFDPMFRSVAFAKDQMVDPPARPIDVMRGMLKQPLDFPPGERYAYSNFGYCLLGRVIEKITGLTYEEYVKREVFEPVGITSMRIGATRLAGRLPDEVRYYHAGTDPSVFRDELGRSVANPYGAWCLETMDSHGGWVASAIDLARFSAAFDDVQKCKLLSPSSIEQMFRAPEGLKTVESDSAESKKVYYSLGWFNRILDGRKVNHWHTGSLPGTTTILVRKHDGVGFVALLNTRDERPGKRIGMELDVTLYDATSQIDTWPDQDLFELQETK